MSTNLDRILAESSSIGIDLPQISQKNDCTSLLNKLTVSWSTDPVGLKYSLKDECDFPIASSIALHSPVDQNFGTKSNNNGRSNGSDMERKNVSKRKRNYGYFSPDENWTRKREQLLRQCEEYLELESIGSRFTKDNFKRGLLNMVRIVLNT